jgi:multiple sugar transport system ATP-binding protein
LSPADARLAAYSGRRVILSVRPEHLVPGDGAPGMSFDARVEVVEQLGSEILLETRVGGHSVTAARLAAETPIARGDQVRLSAQPGRLHFFDPETELPVCS